MIGVHHVLILLAMAVAGVILVAALHNTETWIRTWWLRRKTTRKIAHTLGVPARLMKTPTRAQLWLYRRNQNRN